MKIHVTGNAGAGKTTLAKAIGEALDLPVYGLDQIVWQPGWTKTDPAVRDQLEAELVDRSVWVIEGVSHFVRHSADITIFLDVPRSRCWLRAFRRSLRHWLDGRPELPPNCPEYKIVPRLFAIIWGFHRRVRPVILGDAGSADRLIHIGGSEAFNMAELHRYFSLD